MLNQAITGGVVICLDGSVYLGAGGAKREIAGSNLATSYYILYGSAVSAVNVQQHIPFGIRSVHTLLVIVTVFPVRDLTIIH
jgi:hypothetical protein